MKSDGFRVHTLWTNQRLAFNFRGFLCYSGAAQLNEQLEMMCAPFSQLGFSDCALYSSVASGAVFERYCECVSISGRFRLQSICLAMYNSCSTSKMRFSSSTSLFARLCVGALPPNCTTKKFCHSILSCSTF